MEGIGRIENKARTVEEKTTTREAPDSPLERMPAPAPEYLPGADAAPAEILRRLRALPRAEQREALGEYKEFVRRQKEELAFLYGNVTAAIERQPDVPLEKLEAEVIKSADRAHLDEAGRARALEVLGAFEHRREAIKTAIETYSEGADLFEHVFAFRPVGEVEVVATPAIILFRCFSLEDYAQAYFGGDPLSLKKKMQYARRSGGASFDDNPAHGDLSGAITIEKARKPNFLQDGWHRIMHRTHADARPFNRNSNFKPLAELPAGPRLVAIHEEQHAIHRLFTTVRDEREFSKESESRTLAQRLTREARAWRRKHADDYARTEMLAFYADGSSRETIENELLGRGTLYNYLNYRSLSNMARELEHAAEVEEGIESISGEALSLVHEIVRRVGVEYVDDVHRALDALFALAPAYSVDEMTALLVREPITRWPQVAARMLGEKAKKENAAEVVQSNA